jgi:thiol-disulfide isomerase/thioredoxin
MKKKIVSILFIFIVFVGVYIAYNSKEKENSNIVGTMTKVITKRMAHPSSDYSFETVNGKKIQVDVKDGYFHVRGMENKIIFLKVFGWECKYCQKEIPQLIKLKKQLGDTFEVIAIEAQEHSKEESLHYIKKYGINYDIVSGDGEKDFYIYLQEKYGWTGIIPLTIVVAKGGKVLAFEIGEKSYSLSELMQASFLRE